MGLDMWLVAYECGHEEQNVYWRKANEIYEFFDRRISGGVQNCVEYKIDREMLEELVELCKKVLENHELAKELLPTTTGFFFGSDEYDDWYFKDLERTIKEIEDILKIEGVFIFHAWW